jgi:hypothetical protein
MTPGDGKYTAAEIFAPDEFWNLPARERTGGCGAGKFGDLLVPDTLWGLKVTFFCKIHDFMYSTGLTEQDREMADRVLRNNLMRWIAYKTNNSLLSWLRMRRAAKYFGAVRMFGGPAFWNSKH